MHDDFALLARWRDGDRRAGSELLARYFDNLYRFFASKVDDEVDDLIQATLEACVKYQRALEGVSSFKAYLFTVARNTLYRHLRGRARRDDVDFGVTSVLQIGASPTSVIARKEDERRLLGALRSLPLDLQVLIELHYWEGLSTAELAQVLDAPQGTIKTRIRKARSLLTQAMTDPADPNLRSDDALERWVRSVQLKRRSSEGG